MQLWIIRHGDPDYSIDSLTEKGWREAHLLRDRLVRTPAQAYYVSPLGRARDTAAPTLQALGREAEVLDFLREFPPKVYRPDSPNHPTAAWDWLPQDWTVRDGFYDARAWMYEPEMVAAGVPAAYQTVCSGLDALLQRHGYRREGRLYRVERANEDIVVLFCHFGLQCVLLSHLLGVSPMPLWHGLCAAPTGITVLHSEERRAGFAQFRAATFGDVAHLYVADEPPAFAARFRECYYRDDQRRD